METAFANRVKPFAPGLYRGPRPTKREDYRNLQALGVKTIVNVEGGLFELLTGDYLTENERAGELGIKAIRMALNLWIPPSVSQLESVLRILHEERLLPLYLHCAHGRNRTSYIVAAYKMRFLHLGYGEVFTEMKAHGFQIQLYGLWALSLRRYAFRLKADPEGRKIF